MSRYEELKAKLEDADDYRENCHCDSCEHTRKGVRDFERGAAGLIERAAELLKVDAWECSRARGDIECGSVDGCADCKTHKLLEEMEAL
jgi:hypothetical protein